MDILDITVPMDRPAKKARVSNPNVWFHPLKGIEFDFKAREEEPEIHVRGNGAVPLSVSGTMGGNTLDKEGALFQSNSASVRLFVDDESLAKLDKMSKDAGAWLFENKDELSKEWKRKLKGKKPSDLNLWWRKAYSSTDERICVNIKRGYHLAFTVSKLTSRDPLTYDRVAGKEKDTDTPAPWDGPRFISQGSKVLMRIKPCFTSYQSQIGISIRFQEQLLVVEEPQKEEIAKVDFKML